MSLLTRRFPGLIWLRLSIGRHIEPSWRVQSLYGGLTRRVAWSVGGWGVVASWVPREKP